MRKNYSSLLSSQGFELLRPHPEISEISSSTEMELRRKWLPALLFCIYFISLGAPPFLPIPNLRWYMLIGLAVPAFLLQNRRINLHASRIFWIVSGLSFLGAVLSLLRTPYLESTLKNTVGLGFGIVTIALFIPVLATRFARKVLLITTIVLGFLWASEVQKLANRYTTLYYSSFLDMGEDKNWIGIVMTMGGIALLYLAFFVKPSKPYSKFLMLFIRLVFVSGSFYLLYATALIFARSGIVSALVGIGAVLIAFYVQSPRKTRLLKLLIAGGIILLFIILVLPKVTTVSPKWGIMYNNIQTQGISTFDYRLILIRKGYFIIKQNPLFGIGIQGSKSGFSTTDQYFRRGLIHNTYLQEWAEKGIFGLLSLAVMLYFYLKFVRIKFLILPAIDQIWLILLLLGFTQMLFLDLYSFVKIMLVIFTGIYYEQHHI